MQTSRMPLVIGWLKIQMYWVLGCLAIAGHPTQGARPRFDTSTDMGLVLVPADAEIDSVIFRLRATDQDADFPLIFDIAATVTPVVRIENLPCTLYNKICQANVILTRRLIAGRLHDFAIRVRDSKGDSNSMQATISVTNATTQRDRIFPHIPSIIMVPEDTKPGKELDYILVRSNQWSGKPVYIELWQPKELFTIRQRQIPTETRGVITLIGELDFETQSMYTLTIYATDPYTEPKKDTRNIAGLHLIVVVQDVQDVPPIFTLAPPLTKINNTVKPGDIILRVHAEDGDKGVPREVTYGLVSEGNPFTPFFNISETTGEIILARPLEELTQITHVGAPVVLRVVAEEIRKSTIEPPAQATVVEVGLLLGEPGNSPPFFDNDNYVAWMDENAEPGTLVTFTEHYSSKVRDEDVGKAGVFALKLENNNGTFEISPTVAERTANFIITVRDNSLIDYETHKSLRFKIIAQEVGPATNLSAFVPAVIFLRDTNDNPPEFEVTSYEVTFSENEISGTRVVQVHATDKDTGNFGRIQYTRIIGPGNEAFAIDPDTGIITVSMTNSPLDREITSNLQLSVEARDEDGKGNRGIVPLNINILDVNDNPPIFEMKNYRFTINEDMTNFTVPAIIKAIDADAESPNNEIRYEIIHGNYDNQFYLNDITGEIYLREPINKIRRTRHNYYEKFTTKLKKNLIKVEQTLKNMTSTATKFNQSVFDINVENKTDNVDSEKKYDIPKIRKKREDAVLFTLTARAYDLGVPHMSGLTQVSVMRGPVAGARTVMFVVSGEKPDPVKIAETLTAITGGRIIVQEIRPYTKRDIPNGTQTNYPTLEGGKKSVVVARVEPNDGGTSLVDIERIRTALAANGVGVISMDNGSNQSKPGDSNNIKTNITNINSEQVTIYKAENRLLFWLLIILGLLILIALIVCTICCICPGCPFYMAPRKRRVHSSETLIARSDGRPKRHLHRKHARMLEATWRGKKQAWSADPTRRNWQFNRRNNRAPGLVSLPGDRRIAADRENLDQTGDSRLHDGPIYISDSMRRPTNDERIYMEDVEGLRAHGYDVVDLETLRQRDPERGVDTSRKIYLEDEEHRINDVREQHFYRDGNAEVMRLVTRGQIEDPIVINNRPQTLMIDQNQSGTYRIDGKDIILQRFIEDQKIRQGSQDLNDSLQDIERRSMESHKRQKETINLQQKILIIPEQLDGKHRNHFEEVGPDVQRLIIDHGSLEKTARFEDKEKIRDATLIVHSPIASKVHDLELARQNALLTRLLLEKDAREIGVGGIIDSASYLETQSLPGQVAIATQTDRTTATQTDIVPNRSRSDNDESEEEARMRKKFKSKKRHANDNEPKRIKTLWMKSPIKEEEENRAISIRKKVKDLKDTRRISLETDVLREISDSLDENSDLPQTTSQRDKDSNSKSKNFITDKTKRNIHKSDDIDEPSFRLLEKEMNSLSKKISKLANKNILTSSIETDSQKGKIIEVRTKDNKKSDKLAEVTKTKRSKSTQRTTECVSTKEQVKIRDEIVVENKNRQASKFKDEKNQVISTGSSDLEEINEKSNKRGNPEKLTIGKSSQGKLKRQIRVERKETPKNFRQESNTSDSASKSSPEVKSESLCDSSGSSTCPQQSKPKRKERILEVKNGKEINKISSEKKSPKNNVLKPNVIEMETKNYVAEEMIEKIEATELKNVLRKEEIAQIQSKLPEIVKLATKQKSARNEEKSLEDVSKGDEIEFVAIEKLKRNSEAGLEDKKSLDEPEEKEKLNSPKMEFEKNLDLQPSEGTREKKIQSTELKDKNVESKVKELDSLEPLESSVKLDAIEVAEIIQPENFGESKTLDEEDEENFSKFDYECSETKIKATVRLKNSDHCEKCAEDSKRPEEPEEVNKNTSADSEDPAIFSDNFCGPSMNPTDSFDTQIDEFSYESLQSESSEEQITAREIIVTKNIQGTSIEGIESTESLDIQTTDDVKDLEDEDQMLSSKSTKISRIEKESMISPHESTKIEMAEAKIEMAEPKMEMAEAKIEMAEAKIDMAEPEIEMAEPKIEMAEPKIEMTEAKTEMAEPKIEMARPKTEMAEAKTEVTEAKIQMAEAKMKMAEAKIKIAEAKIEMEEPKIEMAEPKIEMAEPKMEMAEAKIERVEPKIEMEEPKIEMAEPKIEMTEAKTEMSEPKIEMAGPKTEMAEAKTEVTEAKIQMAEAKIQMAEAKIKIAEAKIEMEEPKIEMAEPKTKMSEPKIEMAGPKTEMAGPKTEMAEAKTEVTEAKIQMAEAKIQMKEAKTEMAEAKTEMAEAITEIAEAKIKMSEPKIEMAVPKIELAEANIEMAEPKIEMEEVHLESKESKVNPEISKQAVPKNDPLKSPKIGIAVQKSVERTIPIVPELKIKITDEWKVETDLKSVTSGSPRPSLSPSEMVQLGSPKEFGIADSLFVDAKLLEIHSPTGSVAKEEKEERKIGIDMSVNLDELSREMLDDADDSDSSEASSKTTLTARPYGTPRHRAVSAIDDIKPTESFDDTNEVAEEKVSEIQRNDKEFIPDEEVRTKVDSAATEKVQEHFEIPQETLTADVDSSFDYLPEMEAKEDVKLPEVPKILPISENPVIKTRKTLKDTKLVLKKREASKEDLRARKTTPKVLPPKDSSKVVKKSVVTHSSRSQEPKKETRSTEQAETKIATISQAKRAWRKTEPEKNAKRQDKTKLETKMLPKSETEQSVGKKSTVRERLKDLRVKKSEDRIGIKSVGVKSKKMSKLQKAANFDEDVKKLKDPTVDLIQEPQEPTETGEVGITSRIPSWEDHEDQKDSADSQLALEEKVLQDEPSDDEMGIEIGVQDEVTSTSERSEIIESDTLDAAEYSNHPRAKSTDAEETKPLEYFTEDAEGFTLQKTLDVKESIDNSRPKSTEPEEIKNVERLKLDSTLDAEESWEHFRPKSADGTKQAKASRDGQMTVTGPKNDRSQIWSTSLAEGLKLDSTLDAAEFWEHSRPKSREPEETKQAEGIDAEGLKLDGTLDAEESCHHSGPTGEDAEEVERFPEGNLKDSTGIETVAVQGDQSSPRKMTKQVEDKDVNVSKASMETERSTSPRKTAKHRKEPEMESQSRYMEWYKLKREEMERKRQERKEGDDGEEKPKWLRKSTRQRWFKVVPDEKKIFDPNISDTSPRKKKIKPLVNVESEQLKAIVRQGRALRKAQGDKTDEPRIEIFAPDKPPSIPTNSRYHHHHHHHLVQHSEYKYEKMPATPFYLHPAASHSSPGQASSDTHYELENLSTDLRKINENFDSAIVIQQGGNKLRHQQLLEKKSVFDIAYSEASPSHLRADSTTPPS